MKKGIARLFDGWGTFAHDHTNSCSMSGTTSGETWVCHPKGFMVFWFHCLYSLPTGKPDGLKMQAVIRADCSDIALLTSRLEDHRQPCRLSGHLEYYRKGRVHLVAHTLDLYDPKTYTPSHPPAIEWRFGHEVRTLPSEMPDVQGQD
jgi:hypothetical protein